MKFQVTARKPRNPLVAAAYFRKAGVHTSRRARIERALQRDARRTYE
jgi:hypothetical protein